MVQSNFNQNPKSQADVANHIICNLMSSEQFCYNFFFPDKEGNTTYSIAPIRNHVIECMKQSYNYEFSTSDFGLIMYEKLWDFGTWHVLSTFSGKRSFWTWLYTVTFHTITSYLEEQGVIKVEREPTGVNTRLMLKNYNPDERLNIIQEVMPKGKMRDVIINIYVNEKNDFDMMALLGVDVEKYKKIRKRAENYFRRRLIDSCSEYESYVLTMKAPRKISVSIDDLYPMAENFTVSSYPNPFSDVFGVNLTDMEVAEQAEMFVSKFIKEKLKWNDKDCFLFMQRRNGVPAKLVAKKLECRPDWVDTRFSRLNSIFKCAVKVWWGKNT